MRILVADKLAPLVPGRLQDLGAQVDVEAALEGDALAGRLGELDPEVLVVRSTKVSAAHVEAAGSLALVVRAGAGVNTIDLAACSARGIYVANCPGKNAAAVAELTLAHLLNLDRRLADNVAELRAGKWNKKGLSAARGLAGRTLAVIGTGTIGREVISRAKAFGMHIVAWSRSLTAEQAEALDIARAETPEDAVKNADAVTVHLALTPETRKRVGRGVFEAMRPGAYFVNTSRGEVVDEVALLEAIRDKNIRAGLDVFAMEPAASTGDFEDPMGREPNVYGTHHIGASTVEAEEAVGVEVARIVAAYARGETIPNCVNLAHQSHATHVIVVRHADRVGVLAHVLSVLRGAGINVQEMQNIVFSGGEAACARIAVVGVPEPETLQEIGSGQWVFAVSASVLVEEGRKA